MTPVNLQIQIEAMAIIVRVDGMKADNKIREIEGCDIRYDDPAFILMAEQLDELVAQVSYVENY